MSVFECVMRRAMEGFGIDPELWGNFKEHGVRVLETLADHLPEVAKAAINDVLKDAVD